MTNLKDQTIGIEVEMVLNRKRAAKRVADFFCTTYTRVGGAYDRRTVRDSQGRTWRIDYDSSIDAPWEDRCELVSPVLTYDELPTIFSLLCSLENCGAKVNSACGIHVHVGANTHTAATVRNLVNLVNAHEDLLNDALAIVPGRRARYCKPVEQRFLLEINKRKPATLDALAEVWYGTNAWRGRCINHYDDTRYHLLNLHAIWQKGTIEIRAFNSSLDEARVRAYVDLTLAMSYRATQVRTASPRRPVTDNPAYTFRCWLLSLGLIGEEYKATRKVLLEHLPGNAAWRNGPATQRRAA